MKSIGSVIGKGKRGKGKDRGDHFGQLDQSKVLKDVMRCVVYSHIYIYISSPPP